MNRTFRGVRCEIHVDNRAGVEKGVARMTVDGREAEGNLLILPEGTKSCHVEVIMG